MPLRCRFFVPAIDLHRTEEISTSLTYRGPGSAQMNMYRSSITILILSIVAASCNTQKIELPVKIGRMIPTAKLGPVGEDDFVSEVFTMDFFDDHLYIGDKGSCRIVATNESLHVVNLFGKKGQGPGEFTYLEKIYIDEGRIHAFNGGLYRLEVFSLDGEIENSVVFPSVMFTQAFFVKDSTLFVSTTRNEQAITAFSLDGSQKFGFGKLLDLPSQKESLARSDRHLQPITIKEEPYILAVFVSEPRMELYSMKGDLLSTMDLSDMEQFASHTVFRDEQYQKDSNNRRNTYILFQDVVVREDRVYLLYVDRERMPRSIMVGTVDLKGFRLNEEIHAADDKMKKTRFFGTAFTLGNNGDIYIHDAVRNDVFRMKTIFSEDKPKTH